MKSTGRQLARTPEVCISAIREITSYSRSWIFGSSRHHGADQNIDCSPPVQETFLLANLSGLQPVFQTRPSNAKSSPLLRGIHTAACFAMQPRDRSDINGSGRGIAGAVR